MLKLPVTQRARFVLVSPHYPENVGAAARAIKVMGVTRLVVVRPSRIAFPEHEMAIKMAVKSSDVLLGASRAASLEEAIDGASQVFATTAKRGVSGVHTPRHAAEIAADAAAQGLESAFVFGNEKTGLSRAELELCPLAMRIPMAADQPSLNLAQACQITAYELFCEGLRRRDSPDTDPS